VLPASAANSLTVAAVVSDNTVIDVTGCAPGVATKTSFGPLTAGAGTRTTSDCHITWSTNQATAMLRVFQTDGTGAAMASGANSIPDYDETNSDWDDGSGMFGACLRAKGATTTAGWTLDATCAASDGSHWHAIPATSADVDSRIAGSDSTGEARLLFGIRADSGQAAGTYSAGITFEIIAPDPGPGAAPTAGTAAVSGTAAIGNVLTATPSGFTLGNPAAAYSYQWVRCGTGGNTCVDIAGETGSTYTVTGTDGGRTIRVRITATNMYGSASATSPQTAIIIDAVGEEGGTSATTGSNATQLTVAKPANTFEGDVLVAHVAVRDGTDVVFTSVPAGWVLIRRTDESDRVATASYYKVTTAAEPAGYTWQWNVSDRATIGLQAFSAVDHAAPVSISSGNSGDSALATATGVNVPDANSILLAMYGARDSITFTDGSGMNPMWSLVGGGGNIAGYGRWQLVASGASGNRTASMSGGSEWAAQLVALRPRP
jgi:hypothetical protein